MDKNIFIYKHIITCQNVDKGEGGGGRAMGIKFCCFFVEPF